MSSTPYPSLKTQRLLLRRSNKKDLRQILFLRSDERVNKYIIRPVMKSLLEAETWFNKVQDQIEKDETFDWAINLSPDQVMIGSICLWDFSEDRKRAEVGYALHPAFQGKGIMSEAVETVIVFGFQALHLDEIVAYTHRENMTSIKMLEKFNFVHMKDRVDDYNEFNNIYSLRCDTYRQILKSTFE